MQRLFRLVSLAVSLALVAMPVAALWPQPAYAASWYNASWQYRKLITIDNTKVAANLTDFPVLISITDTDLRDDAQSDGDDILFTSSDGTAKLSHEIEDYDGTTGALVAWVKIPSLSGSSIITSGLLAKRMLAPSPNVVSRLPASNEIPVIPLSFKTVL